MRKPDGWPWRIHPGVTHHPYGPEFPVALENLQGRIIARFKYEADAKDILDVIELNDDLACEIDELKELIREMEDEEERRAQDNLEGAAQRLRCVARARDLALRKVAALEIEIIELRENSGL